MSKEREYQELYDRLLREVSTLHQNNRRRIRNGMRMLLAVTLGLMLLMFLAEGNKVFTLMLWILSMFAVAAYLIAVEYADYELQKKLEYVTQMEQESMGTLLELPELPRVPRVGLLLRHGAREEEPSAGAEDAAVQETAQEDVAPDSHAQETVQAESAAAEPVQTAETDGETAPETGADYSVEDILREVNGEAKPAVRGETFGGARVLERLLEDPEKLAGDLDALTRALQGLSDDLRRSAADGRKEDDR